MTGASTIGFSGLTSQNLPSSGTTYLSIGNFQVNGNQDGSTTTYANTPFTITVAPVAATGTTDPAATPIVVSGTLNGTVTGLDSNVLATFNPITNPMFTDGGNQYTFSYPNGYTTRPLVYAGSNTGESSVELQLAVTAAPPSGVTTNTPEPSTIALFLTTLAGLGLRKRLRACRID
jgi:hypothetical protein